MKIIKKIILALVVTLGIVILNTKVDATTVSIKASSSKVTAGNKVSVTVSFSEKQPIAQFKLDYNQNLFDYESVSAGVYGVKTKEERESGDKSPDTKRYTYLNINDVADLKNVTFTFTAKNVEDSGKFTISGVTLADDNTSIGSSQVSVAITKATTINTDNNEDDKNKTENGNNNSGSSNSGNSNTGNNNTGNSNSGSSNTGNNNNSSSSSSKNNNKNTSNKTNNSNSSNSANQAPNEVEQTDSTQTIEKPELSSLKEQLSSRVETDYTEESWNYLQDVIAKAEQAVTTEEYDAIKPELTIEKLVAVEFQKDELHNLLLELVGKNQENYTEKSWKRLQDLIDKAEQATLKSEYDSVKDELTVDTLEEIEKDTSLTNQLTKGLKENKIILIFAIMIAVLLIIVLVLSVILSKKSKNEKTGRRIK